MQPVKPFCSIIIPTYNRAYLLERTIKSVLTQEFNNFEIIIVDDGSTDNTKEIVEQLASNKIIYLKKENSERGAARNYGWQRARGQYVTFLDSDDILYPNHFKEAHRFFSTNNKMVCFAQAYEKRDASNGAIVSGAYFSETTTINNDIIRGNFLSCFGVFLERGLYQELSFEGDRRFAGTEDWLLWLQLAARYPFYYNNTVTGALQEHDNRSVLTFKEENLLFRTNFIKQRLESDSSFVKVYGRQAIQNIYAHMLSYSSLHLALSGNKNRAFKYWLKALKTNRKELFTRRTLAIIKIIFFS
jgi:glycosyltransferase involved in cell wall biosynthesis